MIEVRIVVTATSEEHESRIVKKIASEFIRLGVKDVTVVADTEHNRYVDGAVKDMSGDLTNLFRTDPLSPTEAYVLGHKPSVN